MNILQPLMKKGSKNISLPYVSKGGVHASTHSKTLTMVNTDNYLTSLLLQASNFDQESVYLFLTWS